MIGCDSASTIAVTWPGGWRVLSSPACTWTAAGTVQILLQVHIGAPQDFTRQIARQSIRRRLDERAAEGTAQG